jgi:hypothetical protein
VSGKPLRLSTAVRSAFAGADEGHVLGAQATKG